MRLRKLWRRLIATEKHRNQLIGYNSAYAGEVKRLRGEGERLRAMEMLLHAGAAELNRLRFMGGPDAPLWLGA